MSAIKREIAKEDYGPLLTYKSTYQELKHKGEVAIRDIFLLMQDVEKKKNDSDPLGPIEIINSNPGEILFRYLNLNCYVRIYFIIQDSLGIIEWGTYQETDGFIKYFDIHKDSFDLSGSINNDLTVVDFAHVLIPSAFTQILENRDIML